MGKISAERMAKMRKHKTKDEKDKKRQKDRERKGKKIAEMSEDQLIELRLRNKINKQNSRSKMLYEKKNSAKLKDRIRKSTVLPITEDSYCKKDYSTPRVQKHRESKKEYLNVKLSFTRKSPKRLTSSESGTVSRTTAMMAKLGSPRAHVKVVSRIVRSAKSSPRTKGLLEGTLRNENSNAEYNNTKTVLERLKERKDNSANVAKRLLLGTVVGSTPLRSLRSCKEFGVSFRTLKKAINDVKSMEDVRFITHMSRSRNKTDY